MKKLIACMLTILMLACALPALAEDAPLHTFAGIPWDTAKSEFVAVATEKVGVPFDAYANEVFRENDPAFVIQDGYYSVLGLPLKDYQGITAYYSRTEALLNKEVEWTDPAGWEYTRICCESIELPIGFDTATGKALPDALQLAQDAADSMIARYGTPDKAYVALSGWGYDYYLVPAEEVPYVFADAATFAAMNDTVSFMIILTIDNVLYKLDATLPEYRDGRYQDGSYTVRITYMNHAVQTGDFSSEAYRGMFAADLAEPFPLLDGEIPYIIIEP